MVLVLGGTAALSAYVAFFTLVKSVELAFLVIVAALFGILAISAPAARFIFAHQLWRITGDNPIRRWVAKHAIRTDTPTWTTTEAWSRYDRYTKCEQMLILRERSKAAFTAFPRSHCSCDSDWQAFVILVDKNVQFARWGLMTG